MSAAVDNITAAPAVEDKTADAPVVADNAATNAAAVANNAAVTAPAPADQPPVIEISSQAEFDELLKSTPYVALQAHATWCGPCKAMAPIFNKHAARLTELRSSLAFARVDIDDVPELAADLGISSIPAFFFFDAQVKPEPPAKYAPADQFKSAIPPALNKLVDTYTEKAKNAPAVEEKSAAPVDADATNTLSTNEDF